jgi:lipoprotein-releasing system ATP-binding protein
MTLLTTEKLSKTYAGAVPVTAVKDTSLTFQQGEFVSIIGPSGSGKSTLMNLLGLLDTPTGGSLRYLDEETRQWSESKKAQFRNRQIGFIFQAHLLLPEFTALENVLMPTRIGGQYGPERTAHAKHLLSRIGMADRMDFKPGQLSGGQNQRVAIARALVNNPRIVFADEPTGALDTQTGQAVFALMREIQQEANVTFVIVTHDPLLAKEADRIVRIVDGQIMPD